jgi:AcrR family transcriptional regulator
MPASPGATRSRILDAAIDLFGRRGVDATSLDEIAGRVGVRKQTLLYWFPSKDDLVDGVIDAVAAELTSVVEAAVRAAPDEPLARIDAVVRAAFRPAIRRPALLGLVREVGRFSPGHAEHLVSAVRPLLDAATAYLATEMERGRVRQGDPGLLVALVYATVTGIATEPVLLAAVDWRADLAGLRHLRDELARFLAAALSP